MTNTKRFFMIVLTLLLAFGYASASMASDGKGSGDSSTKETVTFSKGITTIVTTTTKVTHDKIVKKDEKTDYHTEKKSSSKTTEEVVVDVKREHHPVHNWYRDVKTTTTYHVITTKTWDEVTKIHTITTTTTPVKITTTTVTTLKHRGAPGSNGKVISKDTETHVDKQYGKAHVDVKKHKTVYKKNEKTSVEKKVVDVKKSPGKWVKGKK
jgi:hypothetical protein